MVDVNEQQNTIEFDRQTRLIPPVALHECPQWWMRRIHFVTGYPMGKDYIQAGMEALSDMANSQSDCPKRQFDHWGMGLTVDPGEWSNRAKVTQPREGVLVTEPYCAMIDACDWAEAIAKILGIHFRVLPFDRSWHHPDHTLRTEFSECNHLPLCSGCLEEWDLKRN